nr:MAG TPA: hypothetical protein [Caudoviricetes sp.]DAH95935.1 MAG TPA: hypothetical protein [Caudoviricetes sp.]
MRATWLGRVRNNLGIDRVIVVGCTAPAYNRTISTNRS